MCNKVSECHAATVDSSTSPATIEGALAAGTRVAEGGAGRSNCGATVGKLLECIGQLGGITRLPFLLVEDCIAADQGSSSYGSDEQDCEVLHLEQATLVLSRKES